MAPPSAGRAGAGLIGVSRHGDAPPRPHTRLAAHENNGGIRILRRRYSFTDGIAAASGELDAGLFFIAFQKDPRRQFVALQRRLGQADALNEYIRHAGSGLFACPPGPAAPGRHWAEAPLANDDPVHVTAQRPLSWASPAFIEVAIPARSRRLVA